MTRLPTALLCSVALASSAFAQSSQPAPPQAVTIKAEVTLAKAKVVLGEDVVLQIKVTNTGEAPIPVRPITLSSHSVLVELSGGRFGGGKARPRYLARFPGGFSSLKPAAQAPLAPGASIEGTLKLPTVQVGKVDLRVVYTGFVAHPRKGTRPPPPVFSEGKVSYEVTPTKEGANFAVAKLETNHGVVRMRFYDKIAPGHVRNFIALAKRDFYKGLIFHRVIKNFMIQGGCPEGTGGSGPGYSIPAEFSRLPAAKHVKGALAAARTQVPHSAGSQFYICLGAPSHLDGQYTVFGQVYEGIEAVDKIGALDTSEGNKPTTDATITNITIEYVAKLPK